MREILFRVWVKSEKKIGKVTSILFSDTQYTRVRYRYIGNSGKVIDDQSNIDDNGNGTVILMQYTGLKDRNGTKIFEGDIVKVYSAETHKIGIYWIEYSEDSYHFGFRTENHGYNFSFNEMLEKEIGDEMFIEVIGNIFDNPELLEE